MRRLRIVLPSFLVISGLWLLVGCFYVPIPEHGTDSRQTDFRKLLADDAHPRRSIRRGLSTRDQVISVLGPPPYAAHDRRSIAYILETERAVYLWPLCFHTSPAK